MKEKSIYKETFILPVLIFYFVLFIIPCILGLAYSFTNWNSFSDTVKFIGLENFKDIFSPQNGYFRFISNTMIFAFSTSLLKIVIGLVFAMLLHQYFVSRDLLRTIYFLPVAISPLIIGIIFISIFRHDTGILNQALRAVGLGALAKDWLAEPLLAFGSVIGVETWREIGINMAIFISGLQMIDNTYYEAAKIDGASAYNIFVKITLPFLIPAIAINAVLNIIHGLRQFDLIFALTRGGPGSSTDVLSTVTFATYSQGTYGLSTALNVILLIITSVIAFSTRNLIMGKDENK